MDDLFRESNQTLAQWHYNAAQFKKNFSSSIVSIILSELTLIFYLSLLCMVLFSQPVLGNMVIKRNGGSNNLIIISEISIKIQAELEL